MKGELWKRQAQDEPIHKLAVTSFNTVGKCFSKFASMSRNY